MCKVWTREGWMGGVWILECGWVMCGRLIRERVMCMDEAVVVLVQSPEFSGVASDNVLLGEMGGGEPSLIIVVVVAVMGAISWL